MQALLSDYSEDKEKEKSTLYVAAWPAHVNVARQCSVMGETGNFEADGPEFKSIQPLISYFIVNIYELQVLYPLNGILKSTVMLSWRLKRRRIEGPGVVSRIKEKLKAGSYYRVG